MRQMPPVTKNLLIINVLAFAAIYVFEMRNVDLNFLGGLHFFLSPYFHFWQPLTYMFLHAGLTHLFFNMFALWMFGRIIEQTLGSKKFLIYYMVCGLGAALCQEVVQCVALFLFGAIPHMSVGASGAVYGILLAFGMFYPDERMFIFPIPVPIKAKYFVVGYAIIELLSAFFRSNDGTAHVAHLGGMLFGLLLILYWKRKNRRGGGNTYYYGGGNYDRGDRSNGGFFGFFKRKEKNEDTQFRFFYGGFFGFSKRKGKNIDSLVSKHSADIQYNAEKKERDAEVDRILDKVKQSGYASLTDEEKKKLFEASGR